MRRGPGMFPRLRSKPRCREASNKAATIRAVARIGAQLRGFQATARPRQSTRAPPCVITWRDCKPPREERVGPWNTKTPSLIIKNMMKRNGWIWLLLFIFKKTEYVETYNVSSWETWRQKMIFVVSLPMCLPHIASFHCNCLLLPNWQEITMISAPRHPIIP